MLNQLKQQLQKHFPKQTNFLIALSGGVDSVVLLHLFAQLNLKVRAVHIHHGLSPNADSWAAFCATLCKRLNMPFILQKVSVTGENGIEASARAARYQAIRSVRFENEIVVTAHHQDDQVETFFLALKRGSGAKGLSAMQAVSFSQKFPIFRPLLTVNKAEILAYAQNQKLNWVEDESNQSNDYERNFLRNEILPALNGQWAHFNAMVARAADHLNAQQKLLDELLEETLAARTDNLVKTLNITDFPLFSIAKQQALLRLWLSKCGKPMPTSAQLAQIIDRVITAKADKNPQIKLGDKWLRRYQQKLYLTETLAEVSNFCAELQPNHSVQLPDNLGEIERTCDSIICKFPHKIDRLILPEECRNAPLTLKLAHSGKVKCWGKSQHEEMKKLYQQANIPVWMRNRTPLIFQQETLLFLIDG